MHKVQKLCGFLNFLCKAIVPGRAFTRRLYALTRGLKSPHHIRLKVENRLDLDLWEKILTHPDVFYRPFMDLVSVVADEIDLYTDASRAFNKGFGAWCQDNWIYGTWDYNFMTRAEPSIEYLELYAVTVAVKLWLERFQNRKIYLFCDNESVVHMINHSSSKCKNCMVLIRIIVLHSMLHNARVFAKHVKTKDNGIADALSRQQLCRFRKLSKKHGKARNSNPDVIPGDLWPISTIWLDKNFYVLGSSKDKKRKRSISSASSSTSYSARSLNMIMEKLKCANSKESTKKTYLAIWRNFNNFIIKLDVKPQYWEERTAMFLAHLAEGGAQSSTLKSYVSAIKRILTDDGYVWNDNMVLLSSLTKGCKLINDKVRVRLPI